jgi:UDP-GlcNAc:undecaprenyl-phosphate GlcNAc-1-phosphate transferase
MPLWWPFPVALAFVGAALLTPLIAMFAKRSGVLDVPDTARKIHRSPTPLLGGVAVFLAFAVPTVLVTVFSTALTGGEIGASQIFGFLLGAVILMIGGYIDDRYNLPPKWSFLFPLAATLVATLLGIGVEKMTNPFGGFIFLPAAVSMLFAFVWLLMMTYTTKLLDGVDGLAGSVSLIGAFMIAALALTEKYYQPDVVLLSLFFVAALAGFLLWNFYPARIFLGEGGSTFVGFTLGILSVIGGGKMATLLLVLAIPAIDVATVMARRLLERRPLFSGDRYHLHHLLLDNGLSERKIVFLYSGLCLLFGLSTLVFTSLEKILALGILTIGILGGIFFLEQRKKHL